MELCSRPKAVCSLVDGRFWVHLQLVIVQLRGVGFHRGEEENIICLSNREWHRWGRWGEKAEAGKQPASLLAVLHSTRAALVMDWRQLEGGSPESIKVSSWNWVFWCVCVCVSSFVKYVIGSNLCSLLHLANPWPTGHVSKFPYFVELLWTSRSQIHSLSQ